MTRAERIAGLRKFLSAHVPMSVYADVCMRVEAEIAALAAQAEETRPANPCPAYWNEHKNKCGLSDGHTGPHLWSADVLWDEHQRGRREMASQVRDLLDSASPAAPSPEEPPRVQGVSAAMRALAVEALANRGKPFPKDWAELGAAYEVEAGIVLDRAASEPAARDEGASETDAESLLSHLAKEGDRRGAGVMITRSPGGDWVVCLGAECLAQESDAGNALFAAVVLRAFKDDPAPASVAPPEEPRPDAESGLNCKHRGSTQRADGAWVCDLCGETC